MDKQALFQELGELIQIAKTNGNQISKKEIISYFDELELNDEIITTLCDYFIEAGMQVVGYEKKEEAHPVASQEELGVIAFYEEELSEIGEVSKEEKENLLQRLLAGEDVRDTYIESMLGDVVDIAKSYMGQGVLFGDLIQEGNMGLLEGVMEVSNDKGHPESFILEKVHQAIKTLIAQQKGSDSVGETMAKKANRLDEAATYLAKKLEREATAEELAEFLSMDVEEVKDVMKISLDAISVVNTEITPTN